MPVSRNLEQLQVLSAGRVNHGNAQQLESVAWLYKVQRRLSALLRLLP